MKHVMTWAMPSQIDDRVWADFCRLASVVASCAALPLQADNGASVRAVDLFGVGSGFQLGSVPDKILLRCCDSPATLLIERGRCGSICTGEDIGYLAYGILLAARFVIPGLGLHVMLEERDAGFGMALARDAIVAWSGPEEIRGNLDAAFSGFPGRDELARMEIRSAAFEPLREKVYVLLDCVGPGIPSGDFERATLATAHAVIERLRLGVDSHFDAEYAVESLQGYFRQSVFVLPAPTRREPQPDPVASGDWEVGDDLRRA